MRKIREQRRMGNLVPVEVWIPRSLRKILRKQGHDLNEAATEAFALLIKTKRRKPAEAMEERSEDEHPRRVPEIDLDNPPD